MYTFDERIVSDLHKDARGYRPRELWWTYWNNCSDAEKQMEWDGLCRELSEEMDRERSAERAAEARFETLIRETVALGAGDEDTALRWILEGEGFQLYDYQYGSGYVAFNFGLSYQNRWRDQLDRITQQKVCELYEELV